MLACSPWLARTLYPAVNTRDGFITQEGVTLTQEGGHTQGNGVGSHTQEWTYTGFRDGLILSCNLPPSPTILGGLDDGLGLLESVWLGVHQQRDGLWGGERTQAHC